MESKNNLDRPALASALKQWAMEEMNFHTTSYNSAVSVLPVEKDFDKLCQRPLNVVLEFLLNHVRAREYVKHVKDNLALPRATNKGTKKESHDMVEDDNDHPMRRKRKLETERKACMTDIELMEAEMKRVSRLLEDTSADYEKVALRVRNLQRKKCLLRISGECAKEKVAEYKEYVDRLEAHVKSAREKRKEDKNDYLSSLVQDSQNMETESCHDVRLICDEIGQLLHTAMNSQDDRRAVEESRTDVLQKVEELHNFYSINTIKESLVAHTFASSNLLREDTIRVNVASEARDLSFSMDKKGRLHDESQPPSVEKSVKKLLQASNLDHVMRWCEEQKYLNESWKTEAQLDDMKAEIHKLIVKAMGSDPHVVKQAETCATLLLDLASKKAVVLCLKQEVDTLLDKLSKGKEEREELRYKYGKIQHFKELVEKKQSMVGSLARYNISAPDRLEKQRELCKSYVASRQIHNHRDLVEKMTHDLCGGLQKEAMKFYPLPFICFLGLAMESGAWSNLVDLSIAPSAMLGAERCLQSYNVLCQALQFPHYKSPDQLLFHILRIQSSIQQSQQQHIKMTADRKGMCQKAGVSDDPSTHKDLCQRSEEQDTFLTEKLKPHLMKMEKIAHTWSKRWKENVTTLMDAWWKQPAQHTTLWVKVEGFTYDRWIHRFRAIIIQIHKKQQMEVQANKNSVKS